MRALRGKGSSVTAPSGRAAGGRPEAIPDPARLATAISIPAHAAGSPETVDYVRGADAIGIECCWVQSATAGDAVPSFEAVADATRSMRLGTGVLPVASRSRHDVIAIAHSLARIAEGRLILGLGTGPRDTAAVPPGRLMSHLAGVVDGLRQQWDATIPIYIGALSPRMLRLTGEVADGWLASTLAAFEPGLLAVRRAAGAAGRSSAALDLCVPVIADAAVSLALDAARAAGATSVRIVVDEPSVRARLATLERVHARCAEPAR